MSKSKTLTVPLTEDLATAIQAAVDSGDYASPEAVATEALRVWRDRREREDPADIARLRALWDEGVASGPSEFETIDEILAEARRKHDARKA